MNEKNKKRLGEFWMDFLREEFNNETDRGAVVLTASLLDNVLTVLLKKFLAPSAESDDSIFDTPNAPLSSFGAKIKISERLGLISTRLARDLNLIRRMRNEFAHNIHGSSLNTGKIKDYFTTLVTSSGIVEGHKDLNLFPDGPRGDFLKVTNLLVYHLSTMTESNNAMKSLIPKADEWIYRWAFKSEEELPNTKPEQNQTNTKDEAKIS